MVTKAPKTLIDILKHLHKFHDDFPYSQLALCLDTKELFDLMRVFGGKTLYIPTVKEFTQLIQFCIVDEIGDYQIAQTLNRGLLNGFTETKYNEFYERAYGRPASTKNKGTDNEGEVGKNN